MSLTPATPDFKAALKSFWQRPEGKLGGVILLATGIAGLYGFSLILPWLILLLANTIEAAVLGVVLFCILCVLSSRRFRNMVSNIFQSSMRFVTGIFVEIDPIGILENTLERTEEALRKLGKAVAGVNGAKQAIQSQMSKNTSIIEKAKSLKDQADQSLSNEKDQLIRQRLILDRQRQLQEVGRRMHSNDKLQVILTQTTKMYGMLVRFRNLGDFNVENTRAEIENAKSERKTIQESYRGMSFARKIISGDPEQLRLYNQSLEFLAEDNARKLGEIEDFADYSQKYLTEMDLEQGAAASDAEHMLSQYEAKLLGDGGAASTTAPVWKSSRPNAIPGPDGSPVEGDYLDSLK